MMKKTYAFLLLVFLAGCATGIKPAPETYPFRAQVEVNGIWEGRDLRANGGAFAGSADSAAIQFYGPTGMPAVTLRIDDGRMVVTDMWGRLTGEVDFGLGDVAGLLAGVPPAKGRLFRCLGIYHYSWGNLRVDEYGLPRSIHVKGRPGLDVEFGGYGRDVKLDVEMGTDRVEVLMRVSQGGLWRLRDNDKGRNDS